jgi:hypothetical protein
MLSFVIIYCYTENRNAYHYTESHYVESHYAECYDTLSTLISIALKWFRIGYKNTE